MIFRNSHIQVGKTTFKFLTAKNVFFFHMHVEKWPLRSQKHDM